MSRKKIYEEAFEPPHFEEIQRVVESLGGKGNVSRICKKNWCTVDRWCTGKIKIDFANWSLIRDYELKTIRIGLTCSSYAEAVEKVVDVLKKYEMSHKDADEIASILKIAIVSSK